MGGGLPQSQHLRLPWDGTHSRASTPSLHPSATVAPTAGSWEEDEEGSYASWQGCSQQWLEAAGSCLSTPMRGAAWPSAGAGAGVHPVLRAPPAPQPRATRRTGRASQVAVRLAPESQRADSGRSWGVSQREGSDAGGSGAAAGLGQLGTVTNAAAKGRVAPTPRPALTHTAVAPVLWVLPGRGARRVVLQDGEGWVRGWLHGLPVNLSFLLLFLTSLHARLQTESHTAPSTQPFWPPGPGGIRLSARPGASPSLSILLLHCALGFPKCFPLHPCYVLAELPHPAQTGVVPGAISPSKVMAWPGLCLAGAGWSLPVFSPGPIHGPAASL